MSLANQLTMLRLVAVLAVLICVAAPVPARAEPAGKVYRIGYLTSRNLI